MLVSSQLDAINLLEKYDYRVDVAADAFFDEQSITGTPRTPSTEVIATLFEKYTGEPRAGNPSTGRLNLS